MSAARMRILFMPEGGILAHVGRAVAVADALDRERCDVAFAVSGAQADKLPAAYPNDASIYTRPREEMMARLRAGKSAFDAATLEKCVRDEIRVLEEKSPDVVVGDFRLSLGISAAVTRIPYVNIANALWTPHCAVSFDPPASWEGTRILGKTVARWLARHATPFVYKRYARPFNQVRRQHGLKGDMRDVRACMCSDNLNLLADLEEFMPSKDLPRDQFRYVGPILWEPAVPEPPWLARLENEPKQAPVVYITMGSTGALHMIRRMAEALCSRGLRVVCTTASETYDSDWPAECYTAAYAPGRRLCALASAVVCHGGNGTIYQALSEGAPIIGAPEFHDQDFQMQRVETLGLGRMARPDSVEDLCDKTLGVLNDTGFAERARAFAGKIADHPGASNAARAIEQYAAAHAGAAVA